MQNGASIAIIIIKLSHKADFNGILCEVFSGEKESYLIQRSLEEVINKCLHEL